MVPVCVLCPPWFESWYPCCNLRAEAITAPSIGNERRRLLREVPKDYASAYYLQLKSATHGCVCVPLAVAASATRSSLWPCLWPAISGAPRSTGTTPRVASAPSVHKAFKFIEGGTVTCKLLSRAEGDHVVDNNAMGA
jgi:hypothetical protein